MQYRIRNTIEKGNQIIHLPESKSIHNRLLLMSALSGGKIKLLQTSTSDDSRIMNEILKTKEKIKNAGHAGTVMRFMTAFLALQPGEHIITGTERMKNRPISELVNALRTLGANIQYTEKEGFPPLKITGIKIKGGEIEINSGISSQYISALLMIGPYLIDGLDLTLTGDTISSSYIDLTIGLMKQAGAIVNREDKRIIVSPSPYKALEINTEADWSSASYWFSIAGLSGINEIVLAGLHPDSLQGDARIRELFDMLGVKSEFSETGLSLIPGNPQLSSFKYDFRNNPDMVQTFIPYCIAKNIPFEFSGCRSLRIKETDRVFALAEELKKFNISIKYSDDGEFISWEATEVPKWNKNIVINTYKDHRMALGLAPLFIPNGELIINEPEVVSKSYPGFWEDLKKISVVISQE